ncbi:MAG: metabolite traffic protein EboE [Planctomycetes bacterium]|nr:metabolite traffic protein EboE [Planctomycetota bacterium]
MRWTHPDHPGRIVRLGYCLNLRAVESAAELIESLREVVLPLRDRLGGGKSFGVGMYVPATLAAHLVSEDGSLERAELKRFLELEGLDAFTWNAFPYGDFQTDGLKEAVYEPTWLDARRARYTLDVARLAVAVAGDSARSHLSISTHGGRYGEWEGSEAERALGQLREVVEALEGLEGAPVVLSVEAEPFSSATDTRAAAAWVASLDSSRLELCLDCCHSAVEFEEVEEALALTRSSGLGKVQFSSALSLMNPADNPDGVEALLSMDEPRFLHQVTSSDPQTRAADISDLARALEEEGCWRELAEWRCHFHVPVDLERYEGLGTTTAHADDLVGGLLSQPSMWSHEELHLEIETYTWSVLPEASGASEGLTDALAREYAHVMGLLGGAGWEPE